MLFRSIPNGSPPAKQAINTSFLDPWGNRYMYFYKRATPTSARPTGGVTTGGTVVVGPGSGPTSGTTVTPTPQQWTAPSFVLYSVGPDGANTTLPSTAGIFAGTTQTTGDNADNIYADKL